MFLLLIAVAVLVTLTLYRLFFAPLSHLPGPWYTRLTRLWIMYHEFRGDRTETVDWLHIQYGPVVRIAPDEVSFNNAQGLRDIYGVKSDLTKTDFYDMFVYYGERNTFTSVTKGEHSQRKRLVAGRYTKSYVSQSTVTNGILRHVDAFMKIVETSPVLDVYPYLHYYTMDVITNHLYASFGTHTLTSSDHRSLVHDLACTKHRTRLYLHYYLRPVMMAISEVSALWKRLFTGEADFHVRGGRLSDYSKASVRSFRNSLGKDEDEFVGVATCKKLLQTVPDNDAAIAAECMDHLVAGVDTTGAALCMLLWKLSTPECSRLQERLAKELLASESSASSETPFLDAVITESLRWRPPVPMTLFRGVPSARNIGGVQIPAGTVVGCQAYSLHRDVSVFPDPDVFDPDRWLTADADHLNVMRTHFWAFSSGARHCLGHNIAIAEMKLLVSAIYRQYRTTTTSSCTTASMAMDDQLTSAVPYSQKCELRFERRSVQ